MEIANVNGVELEYEVIGGDGTVHTLSPTQSPELFEHVHGSYGTLGILTKLTFRLVPAGRYVAMTYRRFTRVDEFEAALAEACRLDIEHEKQILAEEQRLVEEHERNLEGLQNLKRLL